VAPSAIIFAFLLFLYLKSNQQDAYKNPATIVSPAEMALPGT
jgi:hypothetical protein